MTYLKVEIAFKLRLSCFQKVTTAVLITVHVVVRHLSRTPSFLYEPAAGARKPVLTY